MAALLAAPGCLVVTLHPVYDGESIAYDPTLIGTWTDADDNASITVEAGEWRSYKVHYVHPIETGDLTGYLTAIDNERYLDLMPARGEDRGSFVVPVHVVLRLRLDGDQLELTPLSFDWFFDRVRKGGAVPGLNVALDQKENAVIASPTGQMRDWLRRQPADGRMFGAAAVFSRTR